MLPTGFNHCFGPDQCIARGSSFSALVKTYPSSSEWASHNRSLTVRPGHEKPRGRENRKGWTKWPFRMDKVPGNLNLRFCIRILGSSGLSFLLYRSSRQCLTSSSSTAPWLRPACADIRPPEIITLVLAVGPGGTIEATTLVVGIGGTHDGDWVAR